MMHGQRDVPGCSTISLVHGDRCLLTHNEDGDKAYADLMFFLHISQPGKPAIFCLSYPGILPGNAPAMNEDGLILTTNYIPSTEWKAGIPRYFLDRAVLDARNLDQAIRTGPSPSTSTWDRSGRRNCCRWRPRFTAMIFSRSTVCTSTPTT
jgi:hypothetical protein